MYLLRNACWGQVIVISRCAEDVMSPLSISYFLMDVSGEVKRTLLSMDDQ